MLQGRVIFCTLHVQIMEINFATGIENCLTAKHQAMCIDFVIIHFSYKVSQKVSRFGQSSGSTLWIMVNLKSLMRTRLHRTCHTVVFGICNSLLLFRTDFLGYLLNVSCLFTHTRMATAFLLTNASLIFKVVIPPLYQRSRRSILTKLFSEGPLNIGEWICFRGLNHAKALFYGRRHIWKLQSLAVNIGTMEVYGHILDTRIWEFDFSLIPVIYYYYYYSYYHYYLIELEMGFYPWQWHYNKTQHKNTHITQNNTTLKQIIVHKATQTIKDTLHNNEYNTNNKAIRVTGPGSLWGCEMSTIPH
jgi:hypothetical protein